MSDAAFKSAPYPAYTSDQLLGFIANGRSGADVMAAEIIRRNRVAAGDVSVMTRGELLRRVREQG